MAFLLGVSARFRFPPLTITSIPSSSRIRWFLGLPLVDLATTTPVFPWCGTMSAATTLRL